MRLRSSLSNLLLATALVAFVGCVGDPPEGPHLDPGGGPGSDGGTNGDGGPNGNPDGGPNGNPDGGPTVACGNRVVQAGEACDDGNVASGDGCAADCKTVESGWFCDAQGVPCIRNTCGDGRTSASETCDDRNTTPNDGCSATCQKENGWYCPPGGGRCSAERCGDGIVAGDEECEDDDSTPTAGDGCSATCRLERGYKCPTPGQACVPTNCGDTIVEGTEQCDDGDNDMGDGCSPLCTREPICSNGTCTAVCGDGLILPGDTTEACDDGNLRDNDGCSHLCQFEPGFQCQTIEQQPPDTVDIPVVYRDFVGKNSKTTNGTIAEHPDFNDKNGAETGIVATQLGSDGKPVYARATGGTSTTSGKANFDQWYRDTVNVNRTLVSTLTLNRQGDGSYLFDNPNFFPLDNKGWVQANQEMALNNGHNFSFTSEARYWFEYKGTEVLAFRGDDDVWVFINGRLAVDLGGVHGAQDGSVTLSQRASALGLTVGKVYEAVVFQAERHTTQSSYKLTLTNFVTRRTECKNTCGDNIVQPPEECDKGANNTGGYGGCTASCTFGPRCGDGVLQPEAGEDCDDGNQNNGDACTNTCQVILG